MRGDDRDVQIAGRERHADFGRLTLMELKGQIREGKRFELLLMPGQPHSLFGPARRYYNDDVRLFFVRELGGPR